MILYPIIKWCYNKANDYMRKRNLVTLEIPDINKGTSEISEYYHIIWYLDNHNLLKYPNLSINDSFESYNSKKSNGYRVRNHDKIQCHFKDNILTIEFGQYINNENKIDKSILYIHANTVEIIDNFIEICTKEYVKYHKNNRNGISSYSYSDVKWIGKKLNIVKTFDNLFLDPKISDKIQNDIESYIENKELYKRMGISYKRGFMFYGRPGCGKTSTINAIARLLDYDIYKLRLTEFTNNKQLFTAIRAIPQKSILVIEDIDRTNSVNKIYRLKDNIDFTKILYDKDENLKHKKLTDELIEKGEHYIYLGYTENKNIDIPQEIINMIKDAFKFIIDYPDLIEKYKYEHYYDISTSKNESMVKDLMEIFDGNEYLHKCLIIITTNHPEKLDRALIRPGRIDTHIEFLPADRNIIINVLKTFYNKEIDQINLDIKDFNGTIGQSKLINSIILPNIKNYEGAVSEILKAK
jgi:hypothetical protein